MNTDTIADLRVENSFAGLPASFYTLLPAQPLADPRLLHANEQVGALLGLSGSGPAQQRFPGHLFRRGAAAGGQEPGGGLQRTPVRRMGRTAGDGRAHLLGEIATPSGYGNCS